MKVELIYVYAGPDAKELSDRFWKSYHAHPAGLDHSLTIVSNYGGLLPKDAWPDYYGLKVLEHDNSGWDIGAFQLAARQSKADLCLFLGSHVYFQGPYWLRRMVNAALEYGLDNLYGAFATSLVRPHIRTSTFWCDPALLTQLYPEAVTHKGSGGDRYEFEHGENSFTQRVESGRQTLLVTWDKVYPPEEWLDLRELQWWPPSQKNLLLRDKHVDLYRDYGRCDALHLEERCQLAVNHTGKHYAGAFF